LPNAKDQSVLGGDFAGWRRFNHNLIRESPLRWSFSLIRHKAATGGTEEFAPTQRSRSLGPCPFFRLAEGTFFPIPLKQVLVRRFSSTGFVQ
jgi:hypothetical protein